MCVLEIMDVYQSSRDWQKRQKFCRNFSETYTPVVLKLKTPLTVNGIPSLRRHIQYYLLYRKF